jgi:hypothetical protein
MESERESFRPVSKPDRGQLSIYQCNNEVIIAFSTKSGVFSGVFSGAVSGKPGR